MKCPNTNCGMDLPTHYEGDVQVFDLKNKVMYVHPYVTCERCYNDSFIDDNGKVYLMKEYRSTFITNANYCLQSLEEQKEFVANSVCQHSGEQFAFNPSLNIRFMNERDMGNFATLFRSRNNKYHLVKHKYVNKIPKCVYCNISSLDRIELHEVLSADGNHRMFVCDRDRNKIDQRFFGFRFRKLKGKGNNKNPFDRLVGIELETIGGEEISYLDVPEDIRGVFKSIYDGSLYDSNMYGEEDDDNSPVNNADYHQENDRERRGTGREFVTIPMAKDKLFNDIDKITTFLKNKNCSVNKSCGMHVHFDMNSETTETNRKTFLLFSIMEEVLFDMLPHSRRTSKYCLPLKKNYKQFFDTEFENYWYGTNNKRNIENQKKEKYNQTRYVSINYHSLFSHGTLENRMHSGTLNAQKIKNWILINQILIDYAKNTTMKELLRLTGSAETMEKIIRMYEDKFPVLRQYALVDYVEQRKKKFQKNMGAPLKIVRELQSNTADRLKSMSAMGDFFDT